jgi:hypothetical protein
MKRKRNECCVGIRVVFALYGTICYSRPLGDEKGVQWLNNKGAKKHRANLKYIRQI